MTTLVKICGLKTPEALEVALEAGADLVGFVFFPPSPRHLDGATARALGRRGGDRARKVALTRDPHNVFRAAVIEALDPAPPPARERDAAERGPPVTPRLALSATRAL